MKYDVNHLVEMLTYRRGSGTSGEERFVKRYVDKVGGMAKDNFGNRFTKIGDSDTAFTCHTDTVHDMKSSFTWQGKTYNIDKLLGGRQEVHVKGKWAYKEDGQPLGADDTTGIWLMLNMISARVPGLYIFHRAEEAGGQGSNWIINSKPELVTGITKMVSLDRKGYIDVITKQGWTRTCSDKFAHALASELGGGYRPDDSGIFTDSQHYKDLIPECTNLSIGYFNAHTSEERQDLVFAQSLYQRLIRVKWDKLTISRDPKEDKSTNWWSDKGYGGYGNYNYDDNVVGEGMGQGQNDYGFGYKNYGYGYSYVKKKRENKKKFLSKKKKQDSYSAPVPNLINPPLKEPATKNFPLWCKACGASWNANRVPRQCPFCGSYMVQKLGDGTSNKKVEFYDLFGNVRKRRGDDYNFDPTIGGW